MVPADATTRGALAVTVAGVLAVLEAGAVLLLLSFGEQALMAHTTPIALRVAMDLCNINGLNGISQNQWE